MFQYHFIVGSPDELGLLFYQVRIAVLIVSGLQSLPIRIMGGLS